jgi:hypothetical protein
VGDPTKVTRSALQNAASIASLGGQRGDIQNAEDVVFMPRTSSSRMMMYSVPSSIGYRCPSTFQTRIQAEERGQWDTKSEAGHLRPGRDGQAAPLGAQKSARELGSAAWPERGTAKLCELSACLISYGNPSKFVV